MTFAKGPRTGTVQVKNKRLGRIRGSPTKTKKSIYVIQYINIMKGHFVK
jgi:hypothetical protein